METLLWLFILSYAIGCGILIRLWLNTQVFTTSSTYSPKTKITVIIPVRNEANGILYLLQCIDNQHIDRELFEVIVVNDASTDNTLQIIGDFSKKSNLTIKLINLPEQQDNQSPKKRAITEALQIATGELIVTTDGDCSMGGNWLLTMAAFYELTGAYFISAPVSFVQERTANFFRSIWQEFQFIEFASLIGAGACAITAGTPNMCSGANIAYKKSVFFEVGGYAGNEHIASGDDEFLMHKIAKLYPDKVQYLKSKAVIVNTPAHASIRTFYSQRKRWASKWRFYNNWQPTAAAVYVALINAVTVWAICTARIDVILAKFSVEFLFLSLIVLFLSKSQKTIFYILITQIFYPFYVILVAISVQFKTSYDWKGRKLN